MFSAPILNPIVLISTWVAYGGGSRGAEMVAGRSFLGFIVAITAGYFIARGGRQLLRDRSDQVASHSEANGHDHGEATDSRLRAFIGHTTGDFLFMGRYLMLAQRSPR